MRQLGLACMAAGLSVLPAPVELLAAAHAQTRVIQPQVPRVPAIWFDQLSGERTTNGWGHGDPLRWQLSRDGSGWIELVNARTQRFRRWPFRLTAAQLHSVAQHVRAFRERSQNDDLCATDQPISHVHWTGRGGPGDARFDHGCTSAQDNAQIEHLDAAIAIMRSAALGPSGT